MSVCFCVFVSSHGSLGAQDKQSEVGYKVCPSRTLLSTGGDSPSPQLLSGQRGEKSTPFKQESLELCVLRARLCGCCAWSGERGPCLSFFSNMSQRAERRKITTRMDGGTEERENNRRETWTERMRGI